MIDYEVFSFKNTFDGSLLIIEIDSEIGKNYLPQNKDIELVIHNILVKPKNRKIQMEF